MSAYLHVSQRGRSNKENRQPPLEHHAIHAYKQNPIGSIVAAELLQPEILHGNQFFLDSFKELLYILNHIYRFYQRNPGTITCRSTS